MRNIYRSRRFRQTLVISLTCLKNIVIFLSTQPYKVLISYFFFQAITNYQLSYGVTDPHPADIKSHTGAPLRNDVKEQ